MNYRENGMHGAKGSSTEDTQKFSDTLRPTGRKLLKCISMYCNKCNEIKTCHLNIQKLFLIEMV